MTTNSQSPSARVLATLALLVLLAEHASLQRSNIVMQGKDIYPESLTSTTDGTIWIGSSADGTIYRAGPNEGRATPWIPSGTAGLKGVLGVLADARTETLWVCEMGVRADGARPAVPTELKAFHLTTAALKSSHPFTGGGSCNDMAIAPDGTLYATDFAGGRVLRWKSGMSTLEPWVAGPELASADGIALLDDGAVYVNTFRTGTLLRVPVNSDGSAGPVTRVQTSRPLVQPDGMRAVGNDVLLVAEGEGRLTELVVKGDTAAARVIRDGFTGGPTAVTLAGNVAYVVEAKFAYRMNPDLRGRDPGPFEVIAVPYARP